MTLSSKNAIPGSEGGSALSTRNYQTFNSKKICKICSIIYFISYLKWISWKLFIFKQYLLGIFVPDSRIGFKIFESAKMAKSHCKIYSCKFFHFFCSVIFREFRFVVIKGIKWYYIYNKFFIRTIFRFQNSSSIEKYIS